MKLIVYLVIIIVLVYMADLLVCYEYSTKKKRKDKIKLSRIYSSVLSNSITENSSKKQNSSLIWNIKQLMAGWMLYRLKRLSKIPCQKYRLWMLKKIFRMEIDENVVIYSWHTIRAPWNISIGKGTVVGDDVILDGRNRLVIGCNVNISTGVSIFTEQHDVNDHLFRSLDSGGSVIVDDRAWISSHTTILPKVHVHEGAVLASGAVATKDLEKFSIYGGIPAKKIGNRDNNLDYEFDGDYLPFF